MIQKTYNLCKVFGIPIKLDISVILLMILLATTYGDLALGISAGIALLISIALHELGHSVVAMAFDCKVRDITLMMMGGCATLLSMPRKAWQEFLMALAGPVVSFILGAAGIYAALFLPGIPQNIRHFLAYQVGALNIILGIFNLVPAFPMDGGRILRSFLQQFFMTRLKATWIASRIGRFLAVIMAISTIYSMLTGHFRGFMMIRLLIAYYIYTAAEREYRQVQMEEQGAPNTPFGGIFKGFSFTRTSSTPPDDDGQVTISPPPYKSRGSSRADIHKE